MSAQPNFLPSDLEDLALEMGAKVTRPDGSVFNTGARSGVSRLPTPRSAESLPPPVADGNADLMAKIVELLARPQPVPTTAPEIVVPTPVVTVQSLPRVSWNFTFIRNADGSIKSITANPQE